jgi:hypothetical protein
MTLLDQPISTLEPQTIFERRPRTTVATLRCIVCHQAFDFAAGESAVILKHIAYGYDFVHQGQCETTARSWIFVDPEYDSPAFGDDPERRSVLRRYDADGWAAALPTAHELAEAGDPVTYEPLRMWLLVEHRDGSRRLEGLIRADELQEEPGGAEFPEARIGHQKMLGYVRTDVDA